MVGPPYRGVRGSLAMALPTHKHMGVGRGAGIGIFQQKMLFS